MTGPVLCSGYFAGVLLLFNALNADAGTAGVAFVPIGDRE
jgi:hypothetical protein